MKTAPQSATPSAQAAQEAASDAYFRLLTENSLDIISILEPDGTIRYESPSVTRILGYKPEELIGHSAFEFVHPDDLAEMAKSFAHLVQSTGMAPIQFRFLRKDGTWCPLEAVGTNLLNNPVIGGIVVNCRDDSERRRVEEMLRESEERYSLAMQGTSDGLWDWNLTTQKVYYSPRWKNMLGFSDAEIGDSPEEWLSRVHNDDLGALQASIAGHIEKQTEHYEGEYRILHKDGAYRWMIMRGIAVQNDSGTIYRLVGSQEDVTEKKRIAELLVHDALHDGLTGLPNRTLFIDRLQNCLARTKRHSDYIFGVLFLDLDRFKIINDGLGHLMGDRLLAKVAELLTSCVRPEDTVARLGGDEFTILLDGIDDVSAAIRVAQRIQASLTVPFTLNGQEVYTTASIGIALSESGYDHAEDLVRDADNAMYRAKAMGKARHQVFDSSMHKQAVDLLQLESDLRRAVERQEFIVHYQAIRELSSGEIQGYEALVRWQHPQHGLIYPGDFIPAAEETGLIVPLGWFVLREACRQTAEWQKQSPRAKGLLISVNLSSNQFSQPDLCAHVRRILDDTGLDAKFLKLEITETVVIENPESAGEMLRQLRALGVRVCLDDFGTGYSSLSYLLRFPIDTLKIDRSFVNGIGSGAENASIVKTIVALAHNMGMDVTAEGVETQAQLDHLKSLKCETAQGYFFSKPVDATKAFALISALD